jgi:hypothetical protein
MAKDTCAGGPGGLPAPTRSSNEAGFLIGAVTALALGPEGALAQRPPGQDKGIASLSRTCTAKVRLAKGPMRKARQAVLAVRVLTVGPVL